MSIGFLGRRHQEKWANTSLVLIIAIVQVTCFEEGERAGVSGILIEGENKFKTVTQNASGIEN